MQLYGSEVSLGKQGNRGKKEEKQSTHYELTALA
jgi:hypothetical protein